MSDPRTPRPETDSDVDKKPAEGAKVYDRPERSSRPVMWLILLVILVVLGIVLFGYIL